MRFLQPKLNRFADELGMKLYGGIDLHSSNSVINLVDEQSNVVFKKRVANSLSGILLLLEPCRDAIAGLVVESTYNWYSNMGSGLAYCHTDYPTNSCIVKSEVSANLLLSISTTPVRHHDSLISRARFRFIAGETQWFRPAL